MAVAHKRKLRAINPLTAPGVHFFVVEHQPTRRCANEQAVHLANFSREILMCVAGVMDFNKELIDRQGTTAAQKPYIR